jgi:hypothetical protein
MKQTGFLIQKEVTTWRRRTFYWKNDEEKRNCHENFEKVDPKPHAINTQLLLGR